MFSLVGLSGALFLRGFFAFFMRSFAGAPSARSFAGAFSKEHFCRGFFRCTLT